MKNPDMSITAITVDWMRMFQRPDVRKRLENALRVLPVVKAEKLEKDAPLYELAMALDLTTWRIATQLTENLVATLSDVELRRIVSRFEIGDEKTRSSWRRLCQKHRISTKPLGVCKDQRKYRRNIYVATKGAGGPLDRLISLHTDVTTHYLHLAASASPKAVVLVQEIGEKLREIIEDKRPG